MSAGPAAMGRVVGAARVIIRYPVIPLFVLAVLLFTGVAAPWLQPNEPDQTESAGAQRPAILA